MKPVILTALSDNFIYLLVDRDRACVIDPAEAGPVADYLKSHQLHLELILNTHHHADHSGGNQALKAAYGCQVWGGSRVVAGVDRVLTDGETAEWRGHAIRVLATPGHTQDSLCYYFPSDGLLFTGDTLFVAGCGRLFEGTAHDLWQSFQKILALPDDTLIYCGHDYALENCRFADSVQPSPATQARCQKLSARQQAGQPLVPVRLAEERAANVFLQAPDPDDLGRLRELKNRF